MPLLKGEKEVQIPFGFLTVLHQQNKDNKNMCIIILLRYQVLTGVKKCMCIKERVGCE